MSAATAVKDTSTDEKWENWQPKDTILESVLETRGEASGRRNLMGASEDFYDPDYAIGQTFTDEELKDMTENELNDLKKLAMVFSDAFY